MKRPDGPRQHEEETLGKAYDARMIRRLWQYVRPYRGLVAVSLLLLIAVSAVQLVQPYLIKLAIDDFILGEEHGSLAALAGLFLASVGAEFLLRFAQLYVLEKTGQNVIFDLRTQVFAHLQRLPSAFFDRNPVGRLMTRTTTDVEAVNEAFTSGLVLILADLVKLAGIVAILLWMDWRMAVVTFTILPPLLLLSWFFRSRIRQSYREVRTRVARLNAFLQETVSGMPVVQLFGREHSYRDDFHLINREHRDAELDAVRYDSVFSAIAELFGSIALATILWAGGWRILSGAVTFGTLVAFLEYAGKFFRPVQELSQRYAVMQAAMASSERIFQLLDTEPGIVSPPSPRRIQGRLRGRIAFENVHFAYHEGEPVLRDVSFQVASGEQVAVVGWTGSGKSTLIKLLVRLYDVQSGRITVDGVDVRDFDLRDLRRAIGVVLQDSFLFAGTVGSNLTLGDPSISAERMRRAADAVQASRFIEALPKGFDEEVRERGSNFSVGEKQLLSFARALAFDPAVLVLDEATSSVDPGTEAQVQSALRTLVMDRTSLVIAHRLATVQDASRILVLHRGELREQGTHEELLSLDRGIYRTLHQLQLAVPG
jgi:ATP-binding cassette, subfamily B, multidrug efflux pump